jgi:fumarylacetoacetate (FAA) hydrolase family protein
LAPIDLQAIKAAGVTFAVSLIERVIEEQARGQLERAAAVRAEVEAAIGGAIEGLIPGSPQAMELKRLLEAKGLWSQYLEVGIGPDAESLTHNFSGFLSGSCQSAREESNRGEEYPSLG